MPAGSAMPREFAFVKTPPDRARSAPEALGGLGHGQGAVGRVVTDAHLRDEPVPRRRTRALEHAFVEQDSHGPFGHTQFPGCFRDPQIPGRFDARHWASVAAGSTARYQTLRVSRLSRTRSVVVTRSSRAIAFQDIPRLRRATTQSCSGSPRMTWASCWVAVAGTAATYGPRFPVVNRLRHLCLAQLLEILVRRDGGHDAHVHAGQGLRVRAVCQWNWQTTVMRFIANVAIHAGWLTR
jgi:hypothetical protein